MSPLIARHSHSSTARAPRAAQSALNHDLHASDTQTACNDRSEWVPEQVCAGDPFLPPRYVLNDATRELVDTQQSRIAQWRVGSIRAS